MSVNAIIIFEHSETNFLICIYEGEARVINRAIITGQLWLCYSWLIIIGRENNTIHKERGNYYEL